MQLLFLPGDSGGPQQHPWEIGAAFTEGFITYSQALLPPDDTEAAAAATATATAAAAVAVGGGGAVAAAAAAVASGEGLTNSSGSLSSGKGSCSGPAGGSNGTAAAAAVSGAGSSSSSSGLQPAGQEQQRRGVDGMRLRRRFMPYPQPYALGPALLEAQLWLLGKLLAVVNSASQLQVLEVGLWSMPALTVQLAAAV